jgi:hypothetical protein
VVGLGVLIAQGIVPLGLRQRATEIDRSP